MAISHLIAVTPPPEKPDEAGSLDDLAAIEKRMGIKLPTDYRNFAVKYGSGMFLGTYLKIWNPFTTDLVKISSDPNDQAQSNYDLGVVPWPPFPNVPGTLHFGSNENGNSLFFLVEGPRDKWPIIVVPHGSDKYERWALSLGTFLAKALKNEIMTCAFHVNMKQLVEPAERRFTQYSDLWDFRNGKWARKRKSRKARS